MKKIIIIIFIVFASVAPALDVKNNRIKNVATPTDGNDATNKDYVDDLVGGSTHTMLSATHTDSVADTVSRGSLIYGNSTPKWDELDLGAIGTILRSDGTDAGWAATTNITALGTITIGAWNATAIDISSYTNLVGGTGITLTGNTLSTTDSEIVHDNLSGFVANEHIDWTSCANDFSTSGTLGAGAITGTSLVIGSGGAGVDYTLTFNGETSDGVLTWLEDEKTLKIGSTGSGLWCDGTTGSTPTSGAGTRLMWIPDKAAFRCGRVDSTEWDAANIGDWSFATGYDTTAIGIGSVAMGFGTTADGTVSVAMGQNMQLTSAAGHTFAFGFSGTAVSIVQPDTFFLYNNTFQMCNATTGPAATDGLKISLSGGDATINNQDGDLTILAGGGDISFGNENLSTTGTFGAGAITGTSLTDGTATLDDGSLTGAVNGTFSGIGIFDKIRMPSAIDDISAAYQFGAWANTSTNSGLWTYSSASAGTNPAYFMARARGTEASPASVVNNDRLGSFNFRGYDGGWQYSAIIGVYVDGAPGTYIPGEITFEVQDAEVSRRTVGVFKPDASMRVLGNLRVGSLVTPTVALDITGAGIISTSLIIGGTTPVSLFEVDGAEGLAIETVTGNTTLDTTHSTLLVNASGNVTITLPTAASAYNSTDDIGRIYNVKKVDADADTVTLDGNGAELIDGAATAVITVQWESITFQSNGTSWYIL